MKKIGLQMLPWIIGLVLVIPAVIPCLQPSLFRVHDYTHVARLAELDRTLTDGFIPPRWSRNFGFGYGMPLFSFYAPLPYYLGEGFHLLGASYEQSIQMVFALSFYLSFMAMFFLARNYWDKFSSYLSATLFIYIPYRAVDTYVRGALGELYGILFIVIGLHCLTRLVTTKKWKWVILTALSIAGLLLSHNLMALIGIPLLGIYGIAMIFLYKKALLQVLVMVVTGFVWGLGLSAYFAIPALFEKSATSVDQLTKGGGDYALHFVYLKQLINSPFNYGGSIEGPHDGISFEIGKIHLILLVIVAMLLAFKWKKIKKHQRFVVVFSGLILVLLVFLMSFHSSYIWKILPTLNYLQFPWRLLALTMIISPLTIGLVTNLFSNKWKRVGPGLVIGLIGLTIVFYGGMFKPDQVLLSTSSIYSTDAEYIQQKMSAVIPDYIHPQLAALVLAPIKDIVPPTTRFEVVGPNQPKLIVITDKVQSFKIRIEGTKEATVSANIFDFPGWQWYVDGKPADHTVGAIKPIMSTTVSIPISGSVEVSGILTETPIRKFSDWVSVISLVLIGLVSVIVIMKRKM